MSVALELLRLCAIAAVLVPGVLLAMAWRLGPSRAEQVIYGCSLGLALAIVLASAVGQFNLLWFYPLWALLAAGCFAIWLRSGGRGVTPAPPLSRWLGALLLVVGISRFAVALPRELPMGWDPAFHLILCQQIQNTQRAVHSWAPFESAVLNYPIGSHLLVVIVSALSRLPLHTTFKDLIPLLGILSTAQVWLLARRLSGSDAVGIFAATAYGFWAVAGSFDYYRWGGLPSELAMLLLIAAISLWLERGVSAPPRTAAMALLLAALILTHHHTMVAGGAVLLVALLGEALRPTAPGQWRILLMAAALAIAADSYFLLPLALRVTTLHSTRVLYGGEPFINPLQLPAVVGYLLAVFGLLGLWLWLRGRTARCHPLLIEATATLATLFVTTAYLYPLALRLLGRTPSTAFTPSRFLSDMSYFIAVFAGLGILWLQRRFKIPVGMALILMIFAAATEAQSWRDMLNPPDAPPDPAYIAACRWIRSHLPRDIIIYNTKPWTTYLAWRQTIGTPIPFSEPMDATDRPAHRLADAILNGSVPPRPADLQIIRIDTDPADDPDAPVLWQNGAVKVVRLWPRKAPPPAETN